MAGIGSSGVKCLKFQEKTSFEDHLVELSDHSDGAESFQRLKASAIAP